MTAETAARFRGIPSLTGIAPPLDLGTLPAEPVPLFFAWLADVQSAGVAEPLATTLATVDADGLPDARTVILRDLDDRGWAVAGPASSAKGRQLAVRPVAALDFWWQPVVRAVRVRGAVVAASREESEADLAARGASARAMVAPGDWTLWRIRPDRVEFWQGATDRRHTRIVYTAGDGRWDREITQGEGRPPADR